MSSSDFLNSFEVLASEGSRYTTFRLKNNGLKITIVGCETPFNSIHSQVIYQVGSADEKIGYTGSTHLLEHLMFKSSANPAVKNIFDVMEPAGATINATTSFDRTNFYCTYAANFLPRWCKAEAMRMQTAPFTEEFDAKEKQVVQDELRIGLDNPFQKLRSHVMNTAFNRSGYSVDTGGYMRDVSEVSFDRLKQFHRDFYGPNNAHIVVVGAVSPKFVLRHVHANFADISSEGRVPDRTDREEEAQFGARQVAVNVESPVCMIMMSYRNMEGRHRDSIVSEVIASYLKHPSAGVLSQLSDMAVVPQALVDNGRQKNRYLFSIVGSLISDLPQIQQVAIGMIHAGLQKLKTEAIDEGILKVIKKDIDNKWKNAKTNVESLGSQLTEAVAMGNISDVWQRHEILKGVTASDVKRVANYLFQDERMTMGVISRRKAPLVQRPLKSSKNYGMQLMTAAQFSEPKSPMTGAYLSKNTDLFKSLQEREIVDKDFGYYHRIALSAADRVHLLITAKSNTQKSALSKVAARLIKEGLPKLKLSHERKQAVTHYRTESHASMDRDQGFQTFLIENNVDFDISSSMGKMQFMVSFDSKSNPEYIMKNLATAIRSLNYTSEENEKQIQMKTQMLKGQWAAAKLEPRFLAEQEITHRIFAPEDINRSANPEKLVEELSTITFADIEAFKNDLLAKEGKPMVVSVAARPEVRDESISEAIETFHRILSPKFYENGAIYGPENLPTESKPSVEFPVTHNDRYLIRQLDGRNEGLSAIGVRVDLSKNDKEYTALSVGLQCLGGGMNSAYNNILRKEKGWTYGTYARLRGGNHDSASWVYSFGSFDMKNMPKAVPVMRQIYEEFCNKGVSEEEFNIKRSNFEKSLKVKLENVSTLLGMTHNTILNGDKVHFKDILDNSMKLTLEDVNGAISRHLKGKRFVHVLCGDFKGNNIQM